MTSLVDFQVTDDVTDVLASQYNVLLGSVFRGNMDNATTMSGTVTLADSDIAIQRFNCDGANRTVKLPASADANHPFLIVNTTAATYTIDLQTSAAAHICTIATNGGSAYVIPDGTSGYKLIGGSAFLDALAPAAVPYFLNAPDGTMLNGKLAPTVASNDLVLTLQTLAGNNPSTSEPVWIKLGGTWRRVTAALSVTKADGTNWCNAGASELATKEIDYFAYLGYNATDGVTIGFSRIPYIRQYGDFSTTSTAETYCAISTITNAASTDYYTVVGRFAATLSAGAGYTWTVPTYTAVNLIQAPIYETRVRTWVPTLTGFSVDPSTPSYTYKLVGASCYIFFRESANGTSNATGFTATAPFNSATGMFFPCGEAYDNGSALTTPARAGITSGSGTITFTKDMSGAVWTNANGKRATVFMVYPLTTTL